MRIDDRMIRSGGKVPFSWENTPGVLKTRNNSHDYSNRAPSSSPTPWTLPPPPCPLMCQRKPKLHEMRIPLPPCTFQPPPPPPKDRRSRGSTNPKKGQNNKKTEGDDPFFAAYKECTKAGRNTRKHDVMGGSGAGRLRNRLMMGLSCKASAACDVRDGKLASRRPTKTGSSLTVCTTSASLSAQMNQIR